MDDLTQKNEELLAELNKVKETGASDRKQLEEITNLLKKEREEFRAKFEEMKKSCEEEKENETK